MNCSDQTFLALLLSQIPISVSSKNRVNPESLKPIWLCLLLLLYEIVKVAFARDTECYSLAQLDHTPPYLARTYTPGSL